jgi:hypothetical protein
VVSVPLFGYATVAKSDDRAVISSPKGAWGRELNNDALDHLGGFPGSGRQKQVEYSAAMAAFTQQRSPEQQRRQQKADMPQPNGNANA